MQTILLLIIELKEEKYLFQLSGKPHSSRATPLLSERNLLQAIGLKGARQLNLLRRKQTKFCRNKVLLTELYLIVPQMLIVIMTK